MPEGRVRGFVHFENLFRYDQGARCLGPTRTLTIRGLATPLGQDHWGMWAFLNCSATEYKSHEQYHLEERHASF